MAILDAANRLRVFAHMLRLVAWPGLVKADVKAAIDAVDDWAETNAASYNSALPQPFRATATSSQKALVLAFVCMRRAGILKTEGE